MSDFQDYRSSFSFDVPEMRKFFEGKYWFAKEKMLQELAKEQCFLPQGEEDLTTDEQRKLVVMRMRRALEMGLSADHPKLQNEEIALTRALFGFFFFVLALVLFLTSS